jgi:hypothetical protein
MAVWLRRSQSLQMPSALTEWLNFCMVGNTEVGFLLAGCRAGRERFNRSVSQVQTIADYAKLSLSNDHPIMLTLKKFVPCYAALSDHFKSGQRLSLQNRPRGDAEDVNVLPCQRLLRQV